MIGKTFILGVSVAAVIAAAAWQLVDANCQDLQLYEMSPFEQTDCEDCEDADTGTVLNYSHTQLFCIYLEYGTEDNIATDSGYPEIWIGGQRTACQFIAPINAPSPGRAFVTVFSEREDWTAPAFIRVYLSYPCPAEFTKYFDAEWVDSCPYCNE